MSLGRRAPWLLALGLLVACPSRPSPPAGRGRRLVAGEAVGLRPSADGRFLAFLSDCLPVKDRTLPPGTASCTLQVIPTAGGAPLRVAGGVTTLPAGFSWAAAGSVLAALEGYDHASGEGTLIGWAGGKPRRLAGGVSFHAFSPGGERLGWISRGAAVLAAMPEGAPAPVPEGGQAASLELGAGGAALVRLTPSRGGALLLVRAGGAGGIALVAQAVRDYRFAAGSERFAFTSGEERALLASPSGEGRPEVLGRGVRTFAFAPAGGGIAWLSASAPGKPAELWAVASAGGAPGRLSSAAGEPRWSPDGKQLAWLEDYDARSRTGTLSLGAGGRRSSSIAPHVSDFVLSPSGDAVAYLVHDTAGGLSVDLGLARLGAPPGQEPGPGIRVARGVFGFGFSPDGRWLYYRNGCVREAEACDLFRVGSSGSGGAAPELIAQGVKSWEYAPGRPGRLLVGWSRTDRVALDLALWESGQLTALDTVVRPGSAAFVGGDPRRLTWAVIDPKRAGVYVAELP